MSDDFTARSVLRLWSRVEQRDGCWTFIGGCSSGYGQISFGPRTDRRVYSAHRFMYQAVIGPVPDGLQLDHLCRNRACCNPAHLEPVTCEENLRRGNGWSGRNARKTHCPQGHALTPENLTVSVYKTASGPKQGRKCKVCHREREAARRARRRAVALDVAA